MKTHLTTLFGGILLSLLVSAPGYSAEPTPSAPKMINLQAVLVDDGGNVLYEKQEADIVFSIIDGDGSTLYEEVQHVPIVNGAISVMVGRGNNVSDNQPTGGIPMEALIPDGTKLLRIKLNEQSIPQEDLQLGSVPYALYAESLSHPIESDEILDGTLIQADLSAELLTYLTDSISNTSSSAITAHRTESGAHPASSISVVNNFTHAAGTNLQSVLSGLDAAIGTRRDQEGEIIEDVGDEVALRASEDIRVLESEISRAGDSVYGELSFYPDEASAVAGAEGTQTIVLTPATGNITTTGEFSVLDGLVTIQRADNDEPVLTLRDTTGAERFTFLGETGSLTLEGSATLTGALSASSFSGNGSGLTSLNGSNITDGTVADDRIALTLTRDSELSNHSDATSGVHGVGAGTIVGTTLTQTLTYKTLSSPSMSSPTLSDNVLLRSDGDRWTLRDVDSSQEIVGTDAEQTLIRKTFGTTHFTDGSNIVFDGSGTVDGVDVGAHAVASSGVHGVTGTLVGTSDTQTLINKTLGTTRLTSGSRIIFEGESGTIVNRNEDNWTLRDVDSSQEIVGDSASQTLTNKTLGATTLTGNLSFTDSECPDMDLNGSPGPCFVDGVDVSVAGDRIAALIRRVYNTETVPADLGIIDVPLADKNPPDPDVTVPATVNHENRIAALEDATIQPGDVPNEIKPLAYGRCRKVAGGNDSVSGTYNIRGPRVFPGEEAECDGMNYSFTTTAANEATYVVLITAEERCDGPGTSCAHNCIADGRTMYGFTIRCQGEDAGYGYDFLVFYNGPTTALLPGGR